MLSKTLLVSIPTSIRIIRRLSMMKLGKTLTLQQLRVLVLIRDRSGQAEMADHLHVSAAAVSKMVNSLVMKKLVTKKQGYDARTKFLKLTSEGVRTLREVSVHVHSKLDAASKNLTIKELSELTKGLEVLDKFMGMFNEN